MKKSNNKTEEVAESSQSELKMRESEEEWRKLVTTIPDYIALHDITGRYLYLNHYAEGFSEKDVVGKSLYDFIAEDSREKYRHFFDACLHTKQTQRFEYSAMGNNRAIRIYDNYLVPIQEKDEIVKVMAIAMDITERKQADAQFKDIIEKNPMSIQILNMDGYTIQTNPAHTRLFGVKPPANYSIFQDTQLLKQGFGELFDRIKKGNVVYFPDSHFNVHDVDPSFPDVLAWIKTVGFALNDENGVPDRVVLMHENFTEHKHAEALFQDIIDKNPMSIQIVDKEGCTVNGNPAYARLFGALPPPGFSIFTDLQRKSPELEKFILLAKSGEVVNLPDLYYNPHDVSPDFPDNPLWIRAIIFPLNDMHGKPERFVFIHENITGRKQAEETLRKTEEQFSLAMDATCDGLWDRDFTTGNIYYSPGYFRMLGYEPSEFENEVKIWEKLTHPDDMEITDQAHEACRDNISQNIYAEYRMKAKDGAWRWILDRGKAVQRDASGKALRMIGTHVDVTERKKAEEALRENERLLRESQEVARLGSYIWDIVTGFWTSSKIMDDIFGIDKHYIRSLEGWVALIHPEWRQVMSDYVVNEVIGKCQIFDKEYKITNQASGQERWVHGMGQLEYDANMKPVKLIGTISDINKRKLAEIALQKKSDELEQFNNLMIGREIKMIELKKEINELLKRSGGEEKYMIHK